jgi:hypothetical protein
VLAVTSAPWPTDRHGRGHQAILVQGTASKGPAERQSKCRFFLQNALILSPERPGTLCNGGVLLPLRRPRLITSSGTSKMND